MSAEPPGTPWRPTVAHLRAVVAGAGLTAAALLVRRPDLLVLGAPMVIVAGWGVLTRPGTLARCSAGLSRGTLREGEACTWQAELAPPDGAEQAAVVLGDSRWVRHEPVSGQRAVAVGGSGHPARVEVGLVATRWGVHPVGPGLLAATSAWGAFRWGPNETTDLALTALPAPSQFDAGAPVPHPVGLVGLHRSARPGEGSEFAGIRPFQPGDRLRRIHWPVSLRTGALHVTSTWADQDTHVMLVVDATNDLGSSGGVDGAASSLDITVRAAAALAEHYLRQGDRVGLRVVGSAAVRRVPAAAGRRHLRRVLDTLATIEPATDRHAESREVHLGLSPGTLVVLLSPLASSAALQQAVSLSRHGLTVVVIDTLPHRLTQATEGDEVGALAWRIRLLERQREVRLVREAGVPVAVWHGPGSLDTVLRDIARRGTVPRMARR